jgi:hypothetical protein
MPTASIGSGRPSVQTQPTPQNPVELYLDLMKKVLTRALTANGLEQHTIHPADGPKSRLLHASTNWRIGSG